MELAALIALWTTSRILVLSSAELAKILCRTWSNADEQLHLDSTQWFTCIERRRKRAGA
jgi:hypothetical protein